MSSTPQNVVVVLTAGKADNGKNATLAFSCGLASLAMGHPTHIFLTSDGAIWGYQGSANGIAVQGFPPLIELIDQYVLAMGKIILCSVCHRTCTVGTEDEAFAIRKLPEIQIGGFATMLDLAIGGTTINF